LGLREAGLVGTPGQIVLFTHDRASDATLDLLASTVISEL
jgi:hypothetical protein